MAQTKDGALKAAQTNIAKDPDFYKKIGARGGKNGRTGGFYANPELARAAGRKGGAISRPKPKITEPDTVETLFDRLFRAVFNKSQIGRK